MHKVRLLCFDGGGVRGLASLEVLIRISKRFPNWRNSVDAFVGTSTGSIIAALLAYGKTPTEVKKLYLKYMKKIFSRNICHRICTLGGLVGSKYRSSMLREIADEVFGNIKFKMVMKGLIITAYNLKEHKLEVYMNDFLINSNSAATPSMHIKDAVLRSSAAPMYFDSIDGYVDGGVFSNNPVGVALASLNIIDSFLDNVWCLSIGTGTLSEGGWTKTCPHGGLLSWSTGIIDLFMESMSKTCVYEAKHILKERYLRIQPILEKAVSFDDCGNNKTIIRAGAKVEIDLDWIRKFLL